MILEHPLVRFIIICVLALTLAVVAQAQSLPDVLAVNGKIERQGNCTINRLPAYCVVLVYEETLYVAVGALQGNTFIVRHILTEVNGALVPVWNYNDVNI